MGFDIEQHIYGEHRYPAQLVLQDVRTLHGSQFRTADLIVASPPCQAYSYRAMPWSRAKALPPPDNELFDACFRIQREACAAAGRHIPMVVENVRGAQKWVGRARWNFGSFYLWGDVPALMPITLREFKVGGTELSKVGFNVACVRKFAHGDPNVTMEQGRKLPGFHFDGSGRSFQTSAVDLTGFQSASVEGVKQHGSGAAWWDKALDERRKEATAVKNGGDWFSSGENCSLPRRAGSKSSARKFASAMIAKIPMTLSRHIAKCFRGHSV